MKERAKGYIVVCVVIVLYWFMDSIWSYLSFEYNLKKLIFSEPGSYLDTFLLKVPPYQIVSRLMVVFLFTAIGVMVIEYIIRKRASEKKLSESEKRYKTAQRIGRVGNWEYDISTKTYWASEQARVIYGFDRSSHHFSAEDIESRITQREETVKALQDLIENNNAYDIEFEITPKNSIRKKFIRSIAEVDRDRLGHPVKVTGVIKDITQRKENELERKRLEKRLFQAQKMESIGTLAGGIAHDFNNILSSIIGFSELALAEVTKGSGLEDHLKEINYAGNRAARLVRQILIFAKKSEEEVKPIELAPIVDETLKLLRPSIPANIKLVDHVDARLSVMGNETHIHQIIMNLCTNAAHSIEKQGGRVDIRVTDIEVSDPTQLSGTLLAPGAYILIQVSDTGVGIPPELLDSIFEPYFSTKKLGDGTGLGLATVYGIVEKYSGTINVDSQVGQGTVFSIYLPAGDAAVHPETLENTALQGGSETIMIVDDEKSITKALSKRLGKLGYHPVEFNSSEDAFASMAQNPYEIDLLITDMTMPGMTGDQLARKMLEIRPDLPIILCSGYSSMITHEDINRIGIRAYLEKPVDQALFVKQIRKVLDESVTAAS